MHIVGESESSLAQIFLATLSSPLIEFMPRLDNVIHYFKLFSVREKFRDPIDTLCPTQTE
jgi:hypothetical protein